MQAVMRSAYATRARPGVMTADRGPERWLREADGARRAMVDVGTCELPEAPGQGSSRCRKDGAARATAATTPMRGSRAHTPETI